eukprot:gene7465-15277_t
MIRRDKHVLRKEERELKQRKTIISLQLTRHIFRQINGRKLSKNYRECLAEKDEPSLTYGEICPDSFQQILSFVTEDRKDNLIFADLGCGTGKAVLCAALLSMSFRKVIGIEIVPSLYESACIAQNTLNDILTTVKTKQTKDSNHSFIPPSQNTEDQILPDVSPLDKIFSDQIYCILEELVDKSMNIELLAAKLCKALGHKQYRKCLKSNRSLTRYLSKHTDRYTVIDDKIVTVNEPIIIYDETAIEGSITNISNSIILCEGNISDTSSVNTLTPTPTATLLPPADETVSNSESEQAENMDESYEMTPHQLQLQDHDQHQQHEIIEENEAKHHNNERNKLVDLLCKSDNIELFSSLPEILFFQDDIFVIEWWKESDVVYVASLLFSDEMMNRLAILVTQMKPLSWFISLKPLPQTQLHTQSASQPQPQLKSQTADTSSNSSESDESVFTSNRIPNLRFESFYRMSWQMAKVYFYQIQTTTTAITSASVAVNVPDSVTISTTLKYTNNS